MDLSNSTVKTPEAESETPTRIQPTKPASYNNGVLKRHAPLHHHHPVVVTYKECLKNFAAALGGHSLDGCGEFMPSPSSDPANPRSLMCAVCGCHRNFHRRETEEFPRLVSAAAPGPEFHSNNRHHPTAPLPTPTGGNSGGSQNNSPSPPPISSSYYPSAPHMLMALSHGSGPPGSDPNPATAIANSTPLFNSGGNSSSRKRHRTKFTLDQKGKMVQFAEKVGWKMQKKDEVVINEFCNEIGVDRGVFKVWMHNNKNTVGKHSSDNTIAISTPPPIATGNCNGVNFSGYQQDQGNGDRKQDDVHLQEMGQAQNHVRTNGPSSS